MYRDNQVSRSYLKICLFYENYVPRTHAASRKDPLDGADPPSFSARVVDPAQSSRDVPVNLTLQLTREKKLISN